MVMPYWVFCSIIAYTGGEKKVKAGSRECERRRYGQSSTIPFSSMKGTVEDCTRTEELMPRGITTVSILRGGLGFPRGVVSALYPSSTRRPDVGTWE